MIIRIETHPTDPGFLLAHTPPDLAHAMGRFAAARFSTKLRAYVIRTDHLEQLRTFARHQDAQVLDERDRGGVEKFSGPLPECRSCGHPASRKASMALNRCPNCGDAWHPIVFETPGAGASRRVECPHCAHRQQPANFCGSCGTTLPAPEPVGHRVVDLPGRPANQDPIPVAQTIADLDLEEPQRERYP